MFRRQTLYAALLAAFLLAGCSARHAAREARHPGGGPRYGGALTVTGDADPKTLNLWLSDETNTSRVVGPLFEGLETLDPQTLSWKPRLADAPRISRDGLTWTYRLKPGLRWSDGRPLDADDVLFTLGVLFDPKVEDNYRENMLIDAPQPGGGEKREPFAYRKLDARTVQFRLPAPSATAHAIFSFPIAPRHALQAAYRSGAFNTTWGVNTPVSQIVTSGPWVITEYVPGQRVVFAPNPHYFAKDPRGRRLPFLGRYNYIISSGPTAATLNFRAGTTGSIGIPPTDYPDLKRGERNGDYTVYDCGLSYHLQYLDFNENPRSHMDPALRRLFQDARFRQAVSYAIDRPRLCRDVYQGLAQPLYGPVTPADTAFYNPRIRQYPYDLARARALLARIGLTPGPDGFLSYQGLPVKFTLVVPATKAEWVGAGTIIADDLRQLGLGVTVIPRALNDELRRLSDPPYDWQACLMGYGVGVDPAETTSLWRSSGPDHEWSPSEKTPATPWEARIDTLFAQAAVEREPKRRRALYDRWQEIMAEQQPMIFTVVDRRYEAVRNRYRNIRLTALAGAAWNLDEIYDADASP